VSLLCQCAGDRSSSPADDGMAATSGAPRPPKPVTKLKLHFGGAGGARVSRAGALLVCVATGQGASSPLIAVVRSGR
jgi:hypothetical protein